MSEKSHLDRGAANVETVTVSELKARCLEILEGLRSSGHELVVTKHGRPIARVMPVTSREHPLRGLLKGELEILGDVVQTDFSTDWETNP